ncbi:hypothetical protein LSM04_005208 [Trypanosoma melophagium]|uniref:uncharacterized protein n=1 Tax=Trypanosoma melophagium TaxID=715481 RepID=UPI00351A9581|nr:hypothetical protein LSM04_005208 [Trypanosoma melophagium]
MQSIEYSTDLLCVREKEQMIYDVNSPQYQQFLRSSGRRREDYTKAARPVFTGNKQISKPAGAASTGL